MIYVSPEFTRRHFWHRLRARFVGAEIRRVSELLARPLKILDYGCGDASISNLLAKDIDSKYIALIDCWDLNGATTFESLDSRVRYVHQPQGCYDLIFSLDVLEHAEHETDFMQQVLRQLSPKGVLVITVPAIQKLFSSLDVEAGHYRRYSRSELKRVLLELPVEIIELRYLFFFLVPGLLLRKLPTSIVPTSAVSLISLPSWLNKLAEAWGRAESRLRLPLGSSVLAVVQLKS